MGGLGMTDAPDHTRLRGLLTPEFTVHRLARLQAVIDDRRRRDPRRPRAPRTRRSTWCPDLGFAVPFRVICDLLGLPAADRRPTSAQLGVARFDLTQGGAGVFGAATESPQLLIDAVRRQRDAIPATA